MKMLQNYRFLVAALITATLILGCSKDTPDDNGNGSGEVAVTGVTVTPATLSLQTGASATLTATVLPADASNKSVAWSSSAPTVAAVNGTGTVIGVAAGVATITATTADGGKTATCEVTVTYESGSTTLEMKDAVLKGTVRNAADAPIAGVSVTSGTKNTTTDNNGVFSLSTVGFAGSRVVVKFEKEGYFSVTRSDVASVDDAINIDVVMQAKGSGSNVARTTFGASQEKTIAVGGLEVKIPASSLVGVDGSAYSGNVTADVFYLSPNSDDFASQMPGGDLAAVRSNNSEVQLVSYGMTEITLTDNTGSPLQLKGGASSQLTFPVPAGTANPPASMPLWYFDEGKGIWVEEGVATLQGGVYVGTVTHFSWHNLDDPKERVSVCGRVVDCKGKAVAGMAVSLGQSLAYTDAAGNFCGDIPAETSVHATAEDNYAIVPAQPGGSTYNVGELEVSCKPEVCVSIINTCGGNTSATMWIDYAGGGSTSSVGGDGEVCIRYSGSGEAWVWAQTPGGQRIGELISLSGSSQSMTFDLCGTSSGNVVGEMSGEMTVNGTKSNVSFSAANSSMIAILDRTGMTGEGVNSLMLMAGPSEDEAGPMFSVKIDGYAEGTTSYSDVSISYNKDMSDPYAGYFVGNGTVNITSIDDESISFNFNSTGMYLAIIGTSYEMDYSATFAGSGTMMLNTMKNNVAWADLKLPADVPELFSPADFAQRNTYSAWFGYINRPKSDYEAIKTKFVNAGYSVALAENTEGTETTIQYRKGAINVTVDYNPNGANKFDSVLVDDIYTISVEIDNSGAPL